MSRNKKNHIYLRQIIAQHYDKFTKKEKRIADYFIKNQYSLFTLSVDKIAQQTGASTATIVRFAQHMGFSGYNQLKNQLINEVKEKMRPEDRFKLLTQNQNKISACMRVAKLEVKNINNTLDKLDRERYETFIDLLKKAKSIFTIGIGISSIMARLSAYWLNQAGLKTYYCSQEEHSSIERMINLKKGDLVIGFSFPPYSKDTIKSMKFGYERNLICLSVTDKLTSPIVKWSHEHLIVQTKNLMFTNSISALSMLINSIATEIALVNKKRLVNNIDVIYELLKEDYYS
ncbi:MAG: MurR/RpiR family transcriptional regulator [Acidobacteriota bacterium]